MNNDETLTEYISANLCKKRRRLLQQNRSCCYSSDVVQQVRL